MSKQVCLMYSDQLSTFNYGCDHPMKPERISMVYDLVKELDLAKYFYIEEAKECTNEDLEKFHNEEYIDFMQNYNKYKPNTELMHKYNIGVSNDTPSFDGFFDFAKLVGGSSIQGAKLLKEGKYNLVLNWIGGLHHAHEEQASGFCYINDCVLAIKELLEQFKRVMYVDIDVHHGDGVEEAFIYTNRVLTLSIHQYGENFFPRTGNLGQNYPNGPNQYIINVPLRKGCSDITYVQLFKNIFDRAFQKFQPEAIVLQCGADSIMGDRLGEFNVSLKGHAAAFEHVKNTGVPLLCLGGGGYTQENVARCWTLESAISVGQKFPDDQKIPNKLYYRSHYTNDQFYYTPIIEGRKDLNDEHYVSLIQQEVFDKLKHVSATWSFITKPCLVNKDLIDQIEFPEILGIDFEMNQLRNYAFKKNIFQKNQLNYKEEKFNYYFLSIVQYLDNYNFISNILLLNKYLLKILMIKIIYLQNLNFLILLMIKILHYHYYINQINFLHLLPLIQILQNLNYLVNQYFYFQILNFIRFLNDFLQGLFFNHQFLYQ